eukprot:Protomagalhaensia_sp_Gyna_25__5205@NODE_626_length_2970_cov_40_978164_g485_i0_p2_GENE_NODE_626_length_2970_cov_40_978164_g485_i0NODE_626_length_2970_cov_40_978164_g485_i0_p2_ORF_typecomplete_len227_score33_89Kdo/PF06293_14/5_7e39RIO1/PF01163_22/3_7e17Pkinase/PF00069_25/6_3e15Pkinase_Tyr/PF07714_17/7_1e12APH/PF01636_23/1_7e11WaaY/PF06176_11/3_9e09EcKinase/PF02958_20/2_5e07Choline_kinase/PF01633_20/1_4e05Pkinase_fungal/PF17667_1/2e05YrbLPhoP_reg/PF10707_9/1_3e03YrbLPhoP_reg/PF10707_9/0_00022Fructo
MSLAIKEPKLIFQGAESRIYEGQFLDVDAIAKERFPKGYRHPTLDEQLTKQRLRAEARSLARCRQAGIDCPVVLAVRPSQGILYLEKVCGQTLADYLRKRRQSEISEEQQSLYAELPERLGQLLGQLHDNKIVHGDLTSSNIMLRETTNSIALIDFGLAQQSDDVEDRAVDLYVLERAMQSTHADCANEFNARVFTAYGQHSSACKKTIQRLEAVRARGRKKLAFG